ncbi:MAG: zinc ribbon domain-containing protein, partial [Candidatus Firestonebacteria bacterium]
MPLYEFACEKCKKVFEELLYSSDISNVSCPGCGGRKVKRKISAFGVKSGGTKGSFEHNCAYRKTCTKPSCSCGH